MSRGIDFLPAVVLADRAVNAVDALQDLHGRALNVSAGDSSPDVAYADLSDAICAALGQILATGPIAAVAMLDAARKAAERRGLEGLESVLLSAFLSAARSGPTPSAVAAAVYVGRPDLLDRLAGGARRVPLADAGTSTVGSVSLSELAVAMRAAGGSVSELSDGLRSLAAQGGSGPDDPTLPAVALACADTYVAVLAAGQTLAVGRVDDADADTLGSAMNIDSSAWRGPATQLLEGKTLAIGLRVAGADADPLAPAVGAVPPGLAPRPRRGLPGTGTVVSGHGQPVPGRVTREIPAWITTSGRTAELRPPRELTPAQAPDTAAGTGRSRLVVVEVASVPEQEMLVPTGLVPQLHPLTGQPLNPVTGLPIPSPSPGPGLAEATLVEARHLEVDTSKVTVAEFVDALIGRSSQ